MDGYENPAHKATTSGITVSGPPPASISAIFTFWPLFHLRMRNTSATPLCTAGNLVSHTHTEGKLSDLAESTSED